MPYRKPAVVSLNPTPAKVRPQVKSFLSRSQLLAANTRERMSLPQDTNGAGGGILGTGVNWASGSGRAMVSPAMINLRAPAPAVSCAHACAGCPRSAARHQCLFSVHHVTPAKSCNFATVGADPHADVPGRTDIVMEPTCAPASLADCRSLHAVISRGSANHKKNRMQRGIRWLFPFTPSPHRTILIIVPAVCCDYDKVSFHGRSARKSTGAVEKCAAGGRVRLGAE